ncbi:MAG TPA: hypothetical protein VK968_15820, partial [Roseimicrobium sp.]|nr:hypothetical protein [Roseimicrobium sp.]
NSDESVRALKGPLRPIQGEMERAFGLGALTCVDQIIIFRTPRLVDEIRTLRPDVYCKAGDYSIEKLNLGERRALEEAGADIRFLPFLEGFSTTGLVQRITAAGGI